MIRECEWCERFLILWKTFSEGGMMILEDKDLCLCLDGQAVDDGKYNDFRGEIGPLYIPHVSCRSTRRASPTYCACKNFVRFSKRSHLNVC